MFSLSLNLGLQLGEKWEVLVWVQVHYLFFELLGLGTLVRDAKSVL